LNPCVNHPGILTEKQFKFSVAFLFLKEVALITGMFFSSKYKLKVFAIK